MRWYILTLLIVFLVLLFSTRFDNASFRNQVDIKLESEIVPENLSIDEPGKKKKIQNFVNTYMFIQINIYLFSL